VVLGPDGAPKAIVRRSRNAAHRLIEEFMLAANEAVATYFESRALPTVYRVHGQPKEEKLQMFVDLAETFGYELDVDAAGRVSASALNLFLHRVEGRPEQRALNHLLLRSMMQAAYSAENIGHFGLAAESYLHFTSPIRRYPDLVVHRLLKEHWARGGRVLPEREREKEAEHLEQVAVHCSERERAATSAERDIDAYYAAALMKDHVGERFRGTVASVAEFGLFIELSDPFVQGLVRSETLGGDWSLDQERHRLVFGHRRSFGIGDTVEVEVSNADVLTRRIDLRLVEEGVALDYSATPGTLPRPARPGGSRPERGGPPKRGGSGKPPPKGGAGKPKQKHQRRGR
jgi:ribonuclease R